MSVEKVLLKMCFLELENSIYFYRAHETNVDVISSFALLISSITFRFDNDTCNVCPGPKSAIDFRLQSSWLSMIWILNERFISWKFAVQIDDVPSKITTEVNSNYDRWHEVCVAGANIISIGSLMPTGDIESQCYVISMRKLYAKLPNSAKIHFHHTIFWMEKKKQEQQQKNSKNWVAY